MKLISFFRISIAVVICLPVMCTESFGQEQKTRPGSTGKIDYRKEAGLLHNAIRAEYFETSSGYYREFPKRQEQKNKASYLWPLCAIFQAENEMEARSKTTSTLDKTWSIIARYYDRRAPAPGYASYPPELGGGDRFYDDNQWIGITALDAYARTGSKQYLERGKEIYRFMMTAYDTIAGGGLYWEEGKPTKNTCSNGPGILLALKIYKATGEKPYLDTALLLYNWVEKNLVDSAGLYYDNIDTKTGKLDKRRYSYNTGTMLESAVHLYEITKDRQYLDKALRVAEAGSTYFYGSGRFRDNLWFNAVLLRGLQELQKHHKDQKYLTTFQKCVDAELSNNKAANGLMGKEKKTDIVGQGGMVEILARFGNMNF